MLSCDICDQVCSTHYNLQRHYKRKHKGISSSKRLKGIPIPNQRGRGNGDDNATTNGTDDEATESDDDSEASDDDNDDDNDENTVDENAVFDKFIVSFEEDATLTERKKDFRKRIADFLVYLVDLKRSPIYKKIITSAREFESSQHDFSKIEALRHAVQIRKFLLDELFEERTEEEDVDQEGVNGDNIDNQNY